MRSEPDSSAADVSPWETLLRRSEQIRGRYHFPWPVEIENCAGRLLAEETARFAGGNGRFPYLVALVGGASAGKSTVFNNLVGGHLTSGVTAEAHATRGMILAAHTQTREPFQRLLESGVLPSGEGVETTGLDEATAGTPDRLTIVWHEMEALRDVWLVDTPDFTSEAARLEGDVTLHWLPWFDRLLLVVDSERWFDRQSIGALREASVRWGQSRFVLFNRTREDALGDADRKLLQKQAERLEAAGATVLEFRRGRGLVRFPPGVLTELEGFLIDRAADRRLFLVRAVGDAAGHVVNLNEERVERLAQLREGLGALSERVRPAVWECMTAVMTPEEREQLDVVSRVLRVQAAQRWLSTQWRRVRDSLRPSLLLGEATESGSSSLDRPAPEHRRLILAERFQETALTRTAYEVTRILRTSRFWNEVREWSSREPSAVSFVRTEGSRERLRDLTFAFDEAMKEWNRRVEAECSGIAPHLKGAATVGLVGMLIVLIAVPGPITALSLAAAKGALAGAFTELATAAGAGALFGKQLGRLIDVAREKLIGCAEYEKVKSVGEALGTEIGVEIDRMIAVSLEEAGALTLARDDTLFAALGAAARMADKSR
jgi:hypothetical protein